MIYLEQRHKCVTSSKRCNTPHKKKALFEALCKAFSIYERAILGSLNNAIQYQQETILPLCRTRIITILMSLLCITTNIYASANVYASANGYSALIRDFAEKQARVVLVDKGTAYVNIGNESGVKVGSFFILAESQILPVMHDGEKPITVDKRLGVYQVMQSRKNLSVIRPFETTRDIAVGDKLILNHNLTATFVDVTGRAENTFVELRRTLSNLIWVNYIAMNTKEEVADFLAKNEKQTDLFFFTEKNAISVRNRKQELIYRYPLVKPTVESVSAVAEPATFSVNTYQQNTSGTRLGAINTRVISSDFIVHNNQRLILTTDGISLSVYAVDNGLKTIANLAPDFLGSIVNVKWWMPEPGAPPKVIVSIWKDKQLSYQEDLLESYIVSFNQQKLTIEYRNIPYLLGSFDLNNDGQKGTLLAQNISRTDFFGKNIKQLRLNSKSIEYTKLAFELPRGFTVTGSALEDLRENRGLASATIRRGQLVFSSGGEIKLRRKTGYGGSLASILYELNPGLLDTLHQTASFEVSPVSIDIGSDGLRAFIVPKIDDKPFSFGVDRNYEYRFDMFYIDDNQQVKGVELPIRVFGRLQGMSVFDKQLLLLVSDVESSKTGGGKTVLMSYQY